MSFEMALFVAGALVAGFTTGLAGFGAGPVALAVWLHVLPPSVAAPVIVLCVGAAQVQSFMIVRSSFDWQRVWPFIVGGLVGIPAGTAILLYVSADMLARAIGIFLIAYAALFLVTRASARITGGGRPADAAAGFGAGVACGAAGLPGPPMNIWCSLRGWPKDVQRATFQPFNMAMVVAVSAVYAWNGLITAYVGWLALIGLPAIAIGARLGIAAYHRINDAQYRTLLLYMLLLAGVFIAAR
ncbi:MAG: sulfite exporter TauE/SafE family protein [Aestuariivirgaceae bacterium]